MTRAESKILFHAAGEVWREGGDEEARVGLWAARADGTGHKRLRVQRVPEGYRGERQYGDNVFGSCWSPDGRRIACYKADGVVAARDIQSSILVSEADGSLSGLWPIEGAGIPGYGVEPSWSPDSESLVFAGARGETERATTGLWSIRTDGTGLRLILSDGLSPSQPQWSPDGSKILFLSRDMRAAEATAVLSVSRIPGVDWGQYLHVANADGSGQVRLARVTYALNTPAASWSPDSRRVAFVGVATPSERSQGIFIANADGSGLSQITHPKGQVEPPWDDHGGGRRMVEVADHSPAWSPDGSRIAFVSNRGGNGQVYTMNPEGGEVQRLTHNSGEEHAPRWSRDGSRIAFVALREFKDRPLYFRDNAVWIMDWDGSNQICVSREQRPCDSPDIF